MLDHEGQEAQEDWAQDSEESPEGEELAEQELVEDEDSSDEDSATPPKAAISRNGLVASVVALTAVAVAVAYALGSGLIQPGFAGVWLATAIPVAVSPLVYWLCMKQGRREAAAWEADSAAAVRLLASEDVPQFRGDEPLAEVLVGVAETIHAKATERLSEQAEVLKTTAHHELVRVRSHCEQLIEKHAERMLREKRDIAVALQRQKESGKEVEGAREELEQELEKESSSSAELRERVTQLEKEVAREAEEVARVLEEVQRLNDENANLKLNSVKFFDKVAAQIRGSIKIVNKLLREMSSGNSPEDAHEVSGKAPRPTEEYIAEIASRTQQLDRIIDQILDLCRIESAGLSLVYSEVDTGELVKSSVSKLSDTATANGVKLTSQVPSAAPIVATDARLLGRILREISANAVRFTPKGGRVTVSVALSSQAPPSGKGKPDPDMAWLQLTIKDTGPGIPQEDQGRIFRAFERGSEPHFTMVDAGAGLGLTLSRHYASMLGGEIRLRCQEGQGSTFTFDLPVKVLQKTRVG